MSASALFDAIREGDLSRFQEIAVQDPSLLNAVAPSGHSVARLAADSGQDAICCWLAENLEPTDPFDMIALARPDLLHGLDPEQLLLARSFDGWSPLHLTAFYGRVNMVQWLIDQGASVTALSANPTKNQPLHAAIAGACCEQTVDVLLAADAPPDSRAASDVTPLHLAAARGNRAVVAKLLDAGADPAATLSSGQTPAELARERDHAELADWMTNR